MKNLVVYGGILCVSLAIFLGFSKCSRQTREGESTHSKSAHSPNYSDLKEPKNQPNTGDSSPENTQARSSQKKSGLPGQRPPQSTPNRISTVPPPKIKLDLHPSEQLGREENSPAENIAHIFELFNTYKRIIKSAGTPIGLNEDLVLALIGKNLEQIEFLSREHPRINEEGLLVDKWKSPYHFHFQSSTEIEIRSAGPDTTLFTKDDIIRSSRD